MITAYLLAYLIFFLAFGVGSSLARRGHHDGFLVLGSLLALIGGGGFLSLIVDASSELGNALVLRALAALVFATMFLSGGGLVVSSFIQKLQGKRTIQGAILGFVLIVPVAVGVAKSYSANTKLQEQAESRATLELTDVSGTFGGHRITIPISPVVSLATQCDVPPGVSQSICHFWGGNSFENFVGFGSTTLDFSSISFLIPDCKKSDCTQLENWCERRPNLNKSVWCWTGSRIEIAMRTDRIQSGEENTNRPLFVQSAPVEGLSIRCFELFSNKVSCDAHFEVTPGVRTNVSIWDIEPGNEETKVREIKSHAERLWAEMISAD